MAPRVALATRSKSKAEPYRCALETAGLEPALFVPDSGQLLDSVAGLLLTGGTDVDPALYGAARHAETNEPDRARDDYEIALVRAALAKDIPVLAVCRGQQLFNVACGGSLIQHLPGTHKHRQLSDGAPVHDVVLEGRMAEIFHATRMPVNSRHHQAVDRPGEGLLVTASDPEDGVIEGLTLPAARFAVCVQWHPEEMVDERQARLFRAFAASLSLR
jgi:gamma-glutamyl-gamma-aminobutyrate hydrolase PuuD